MVTDILKDADQIVLRNMERGKYFRIAADVIVDGENLSDLLIGAGMAIRYNGGKKEMMNKEKPQSQGRLN